MTLNHMTPLPALTEARKLLEKETAMQPASLFERNSHTQTNGVTHETHLVDRMCSTFLVHPRQE